MCDHAHGDEESPVNIAAAVGGVAATEFFEEHLGRVHDAGFRGWPATIRAMETLVGPEMATEEVRMIHAIWEVRFRPLISDGQTPSSDER